MYNILTSQIKFHVNLCDDNFHTIRYRGNYACMKRYVKIGNSTKG